MTKKKMTEEITTTNATLEPRLLPFQELLEKGYLQEVNRQFFHPMGLSLAYVSGKNPRLVVYDFRYTPSGPMYSPEVLKDPKFLERMEGVALECAEKLLERQMTFGFGIQVPNVHYGLPKRAFGKPARR